MMMCRNRSPRHWLLIVALVLAAGCPKNQPAPPAAKPSAPPPARIEAGPEFEARIEALTNSDDFAGAIALVADFIHHLPAGPERDKNAAYANELLADLYVNARARAVAVDAGAKRGAILVTRDCDPRLDAYRCPPAGTDAFFNVIKHAGRKVEFRVPAQFVSFFRYDLVIVDACSPLADRKELEALQWYVFAGGRVLALADVDCKDHALAINRLLTPMGLTFAPASPSSIPEMTVASAHPLLAGITRLNVARAAAVSSAGPKPLAPILARPDGKVIMAETGYGLGRVAAWGNPDVVADPLFAPVLANLIRALPGQDKITAVTPEDLAAKVAPALAEGKERDAIVAINEFITAAEKSEDSAAALALGREQLAAIFTHARGEARARSPEVPPGAVLYLADCDPRRDPDFCGLAGSADEIKPFFSAFESAGRTLAIGIPNDWRDLFLYDLIIVDACSAVADRDYYLDLRWFIFAGGRTLVLGDQYCQKQGSSSASRANRLLDPIGLAFTNEDPRDLNLIAVTGTHPYLAGVRSIDAFRVTPVRISNSKDKTILTLIARPDGQPLLVLRPYGLGQVLAWGSTDIIAEQTFTPIVANLIK
jgi:hypothetical protein